MRAHSNWNFSHYVPMDEVERVKMPYISRIAPFPNAIEIEWGDNENDGAHTLVVRIVGRDEWKEKPLGTGRKYLLRATDDEEEYEFYVKDGTGRRSVTRRAKSGEVFGYPVDFLHPADSSYSFSGNFLASPSVVRFDDGYLLASADVFGHGTPQNLSIIYSSSDGGKTWNYVTELMPCFWGKLFLHRGVLYMLALSTEYGDLIIGKSLDRGKTWSQPLPLERGTANAAYGGPNRAPCNILNYGGRLWFSCEYGSRTKKSFANTVFSIDENDDLMDTVKWHFTPLWHHDMSYEGTYNAPGAVEGNIVVMPDGTLVNFLNYGRKKALLLKINKENPDAPLEFLRVIPFLPGDVKFEIFDYNGLYYAVGNTPPDRCVLALYKSTDLLVWEHVKDIVNCREYNPDKVGYQCPSVALDGDEAIILSRTAILCSRTFHDSNMLTCHRIKIK